jgi:hypothetical protein
MATQEHMPVSGSDGDSQFFDKAFDGVAEETMNLYHVPGLAIGIIYKGKTYAKVW